MSQAFVYFIKPVGMDGPVKIGCSEAPQSRLSALASWSPIPLEIVATVPGDFKLEQNVHECFSEFYSHREWFHANPKLTCLITALVEGTPIEEAIDLSSRTGKIPKKKCGGAGWSDLTRQYMSVFHRVRHAEKRRGRKTAYRAPEPIQTIMKASQKRLLTPEEFAVVDSYCSAAPTEVAA